MAIALLRINHLVPLSHANGPGPRAVLWVQGCSLACPGCFNPQTHPFQGGQEVPVDDLRRRFAAWQDRIEGITVSGGEPLQQRGPLLALLEAVRRETALSVLLFTGFTWDEVRRLPESDALLACVDVLLAGRYEASRHLGQGLRGSANKTAHFLTARYTPADLERVPPAEILITPHGEILLSGIDPPRWPDNRVPPHWASQGASP